jgi:hypothetical protein
MPNNLTIKPFDVDVKGIKCRLTRMDDARYLSLWGNSVPLQGDGGFWVLLQLGQPIDSLLNLAEFYTVFKERFGESGSSYDHSKGAFSFPFELEVFKGDTSYIYLLDVVNWRSTYQFNFRKELQPGETRFDRKAHLEPFEDEFSTLDMNTLIVYLHGFATGYLKSINLKSVAEFVRQVPSNIILFGFEKGQFFTRYYENQDEFEKDRDLKVRDIKHPYRKINDLAI